MRGVPRLRVGHHFSPTRILDIGLVSGSPPRLSPPTSDPPVPGVPGDVPGDVSGDPVPARSGNASRRLAGSPGGTAPARDAVWFGVFGAAGGVGGGATAAPECCEGGVVDIKSPGT
jgi:hypothetical protein